jgi:hypothetical protein
MPKHFIGVLRFANKLSDEESVRNDALVNTVIVFLVLARFWFFVNVLLRRRPTDVCDASTHLLLVTESERPLSLSSALTNG